MSELLFSESLVEPIDFYDLPMDRDVLSGFLEASDAFDNTHRSLLDLLGADPVFCAGAALSASAEAFRSRGPLSPTLESVASRLGPRGLTSLGAQIAIHQQFSPPQPDQEVAVAALRYRGALRGRIALALATALGYERPSEAQFAALFLDLGRIALLGLGQTSNIIDENRRESEVGARLLASWGYGSLVSQAVRYQHEQTDQMLDAHPLVKIVHAARRLSEAGPRQVDLVCQVLAVLLDSDAGTLRSLTEAAVAEAPEVDQIPELEAHEAKFVPESSRFTKMLATRALEGEMCTYWSAAETEQDILSAIAQVLAISFGLRRVLYLRRDGERLKGVDLFGTEPAISGMYLKDRRGAGLVRSVMATGKPAHSLDEDSPALTVADKQIMDLLNCGGMLCTPIAHSGEQLGVFVAGVHPSRQAWLDSQKDLLGRFALEAGMALAAVHRRQAYSDSVRRDTRSECRIQARRAAHELRTPLAIMGNYLSVIRAKLDQNEQVDSDLDAIAQELARSGRILGDFSGGAPEKSTTGQLDLNSMVSELTTLLESTLMKDSGIQLITNLDDQVPSGLELDGDHVRQLLVNLVRNAIEAMPDGGSLQVVTEDRVRFESEDYVAISIIDTGPGLPAEVERDLFKPVRTTKGGEHQGLGLNIVKDLADRLAARIVCRSSKGSGTTFTVLMPRMLSAAKR